MELLSGKFAMAAKGMIELYTWAGTTEKVGNLAVIVVARLFWVERAR